MTKILPGICFLLLLLPACKHEIAGASSCVDQFLATNNLVAYTGQDIGCKSFVSLHELDGKEYFHTDNPCADMVSIPVDCDGNLFCPSADDPKWAVFFKNALDKGIVGVQP